MSHCTGGAAPAPDIRSGRLIALRLFELAYAIDLSRAEQLWAEGGPGARRRLTATPAKAVDFGVAPLDIALGTLPLILGEQRLEVAASARLHDFGIVTLSLSIPADDLTWAGFAARLDAAQARLGVDAAEAPWPALLARLRKALEPALDRPNATPIEEDYLIGMITAFDAPITAEALLARADLASLLVGAQPRPLSDGARADLLRPRFSWHEDDLVLLGWDRAILVEPRGETDVLDVLEVANAQLLEMRFYDELLDAELPRMYEMVSAAQRGARLLAGRRYAGLARRLTALVAEVTEQTERVDNALQVTEDVHLARIYAAAMALFRVPVVGQAVDRKLAVIRDTYRSLHEEAAGARAELLEIAIVLLIVTEIVLSLVRH
jgi:hypothetical protein